MLLTSSTLAALRYFEAAARLSSFKDAAAELNVTQGAVSQQIKGLEEALGCKLFERLPRCVNLTAEGRHFALTVSAALSSIEDAALKVSHRKSKAEVHLRAGPSFSLRWLVPRLGDFYAGHPHIKLFVEAKYGAFDVQRRDFDLAIELIRSKPRGLAAELFKEEYLLPVCSPAYLKRHSPLAKPQDLSRCTLLHDAQPWDGATPDAEWNFWLQAARFKGVDSNRGQFFSLANMAIEAALSHQGVAMGRSSLVSDALRSGQLLAPFPQRIKSPVKYLMVYPKESLERPETLAVVRWLRKQVTESEPGQSPKQSQ